MEQQAKTAAEIQRERVAADLTNHLARIEWLSGDSPRWSCGTPVDGYMRRELLRQSQAFVAAASN